MMKRSTFLWLFTLALVAQHVSPGSLFAQEIAPGHILNPTGSQKSSGVAWNSIRKEYMLIFHGNDVRVRRMDTDGILLGDNISLSGNVGINSVGIEYNPVEDGYIVGYRDSNDNIYIRHLSWDGQPLSGPFFVGSGGSFGGGGGGALSVTSQRVLIVWRVGPAPIKVKYALMDADPTTANARLATGQLVTGDGPAVDWNPTNDTFLVAYVVDGGAAKEQISGNIVNIVNDNVSGGGNFAIAHGNKSQTKPEVAYSSSTNSFLVTMEDRRNNSSQNANVTGQRVSATGVKIGSRFNIVANGSNIWDVPGPIDYSEVTGKFIVTAFYATKGVAVEVDPVTADVGPQIVFGFNQHNPVGITTNDDFGDPQAVVLSKVNLGGDGVHAHIIDLPTAPPTFTTNNMVDGFFGVFYDEMLPVAGGTPPLFFEKLSGSYAPGITTLNSATGHVSGTPTTVGPFGPIRFRVTDDEGRVAEADLFHNITLGVPGMVAPLAGATSDTTPTFDWDDVPGATTYRLVVDNITSGGTPIDMEIADPQTEHTPGANLPAGNLYQWKVQAKNGAIVGAFSNTATFEIDTLIPPPVAMGGLVPSGLAVIPGLTAIEASSEWTSNGGAKENIVDGVPETKWQSTSKNSVTTEFVTIDLGGTFPVARVRLYMPFNSNVLLFPKGFSIQVSDQPDANFTTVHTEPNFVAQQGMWYEFVAAPVLTRRYVRIWITDTNFYVNKYPFNALIGEVEVLEDNPVFGTIQYNWQAPADDAGAGTEPVFAYDLRVMAGGPGAYNYFSAQALVIVTNEPAPVLNAIQSVVVDTLNDETTYSAALTSVDDAGNRSAVSNIVTLATRGVPPAAIANLRAFSPTKTSMELDWDAPTEDGPAGGKVTSYEVRYSETPITSSNLGSLVTDETPPAPANPGTTQTMTVNALDPTTHYYFSIISRDEVGQASPLSNIAELATLDGTPPAGINDLQGISGGGVYTEITPLTAANSSGFIPGFAGNKAVDDDESTYWSSPGVKPTRIEYITVNAGSETNVGRVRLLASNQSPLLFAKSFEILVGNDPNNNFTTGLTVSNFVAESSNWYTFDLPVPISGQYVRIRITEMNAYSNGKFYSQFAEIEVFDLAAAADGVMLLWTAPGNNGNQGQATKYHVRYSTTEIVDDDDYDNATQVPDGMVPAPQPAGFPESLTLTGLGPEQVIWAAIKTVDGNSNVSVLSNIVKVSTPGNPPGTVTNLTVLPVEATGSSIRIQFTEPADDAGDNGSGPVDHYEVGCSTGAINGLGDFVGLTFADPGPTPVGPGNTLQFDIPGLANQTAYNCAVRAVDDADLTSPLSTVVSGSTIDDEPPAQVSNLSVDVVVMSLNVTVENSSGALTPASNALDGDPATAWISPGVKPHREEWITVDLGSSVTVGQVRLQSNNQSPLHFPADFKIQVGNNPNGPFTDALVVTDFVATLSTFYTFNVTPTAGRYVRIRATKVNEYTNGKFYASFAEIEVSEQSGPAIEATLTWNAPADDGSVGDPATSYEIRMDTSLINAGNFGGADLVATGLVPQAPGSPEVFVITSGIVSGQTNWFAIETKDEAGLRSVSVISAAVP